MCGLCDGRVRAIADRDANGGRCPRGSSFRRRRGRRRRVRAEGGGRRDRSESITRQDVSAGCTSKRFSDRSFVPLLRGKKLPEGEES